ncbi:MAG: hypothetical protein OXM54_17030 [Acidimicrobiaceae bacterium]|nr:hypothetical protein [Acidimicrobiaceae bacterium]
MKFSAKFNIVREPSDDWFDPDLALDTRLFLDPFLLLAEEENAESNWQSAHRQLIKHFARCYELLARAGSTGTLSEQVVLGLLRFPEPSELCLGYASSGTSGSGSGGANARLIMGSIVTAIAAGLTQPEHIEEIGILNEGIGADRISDATCNVLKPTIIRYTKTVVVRHRIPTERIRVRHSRCSVKTGRWIDEYHDLPRNPYTGGAILLVPQRFLNSLPTLNADDWFDSTFNADLRRDLNVEVGQRVPKRRVVEAAHKHPERIREWAQQLRLKGEVRGYDFAGDPLGVSAWQGAGEDYAKSNPISMPMRGAEDLSRFVSKLLSLYKDFVEKQGGWRLLWNDNGEEKPERAAQLLLAGIARPHCRTHGVEICREVDLGSGLVDFKISSGASLRVLIEVKKLHAGRFWNGIEQQLPTYMASDETDEAWLLAVRYRTKGASIDRLRKLPRVVKRVNESLEISISSMTVDARRKLSASEIRRL